MIETKYLICFVIGISIILVLYLIYFFYFRKKSLKIIYIEEKQSIYKLTGTNFVTESLEIKTSVASGIFQEWKIPENGYLFHIKVDKIDSDESAKLLLDGQQLSSFTKGEAFEKHITPIPVKKDQVIRFEIAKVAGGKEDKTFKITLAVQKT